MNPQTIKAIICLPIIIATPFVFVWLVRKNKRGEIE